MQQKGLTDKELQDIVAFVLIYVVGMNEIIFNEAVSEFSA